jgi:NADH-quinone oxidoreductase subunit G
MAEPVKPPETVSLTIDGRSVTVPKGTMIIEAAERAGIRVPHYCYHAGLSSPAMCRLCLVEVQGAPKLVPSCVTTVAEGQVVFTETEKSLSMRRGVLEFYLVNHPLDCPICDQSGECKLQDYVSAEGRKRGRSREPKRVFGRDDFGGDVLFYGDRCVMCTRCVRFMNEVEKDPRLTVVERGDRAIIDTFFEEGLENTYFSGNVVDICPVGALVSKDFLFKQRAWDLDHTPSVCPNCSHGCNIELHTRDNLVQRLKPRANPDVNGYWMCDYGRARYEWINHGERLEVPLLRRDGAAMRAVGWGEALGFLVDRLRELEGTAVHAVVSPFASNEDVAALAALVKQLGGLDGVGSSGDVILVLGDALADQPESFGSEAGLYVYLGQHGSEAASHAHLALPITSFAEQEGSFTNAQGRVQRFWPAIEPPGAARPAWLVLHHVRAALGGPAAPASPDDAFARIGETAPEFDGLTYLDIGTRGALLNEPATLAGAGRGKG